MGQLFAKNSIKAGARLRAGPANTVYTNVPKLVELVGHVGWPTTEHTTVEIPDGAPVMERSHHQEKTVTAVGTNLMATAWRQPRQSRQLPKGRPLGMSKEANLSWWIL